MTRADILHPLTAVSLLDFETLYARCDEAARAVLDAAQRLASWRARQAGEVNARLEALRRAPWPGEERGAWTAASSSAVSSGDVLRALLALAPELARGCLRGVLTREALDSMTTTWREALAHAPAVSGAPLEVYWARSLSISEWFTRAGEASPPLGRGDLMAMVDDYALGGVVALNEDYEIGARTRAETLALIDITRAEELARAWGVRTRLGEMPAAFVDRRGGLRALDEATRRPPGAVILGAPGSGRGRLLERWIAARGRELTIHRASPYELGARPASARDPQLRGQLWAFPAMCSRAATRPQALGGEAITADERRALAQRARHGIEVASRYACGREHDLRIVVVAEPDDWAELLLYIPQLRELARVELSPITAVELAAIWACQLPALEDALRRPVPLQHLLRAVSQRPEERRLELSRVEDLADLPSSAPFWWRLIRRDPARLLTRLHKRYGGALRPMIPDLETLTRLGALAEALTPGCPARAPFRRLR